MPMLQILRHIICDWCQSCIRCGLTRTMRVHFSVRLAVSAMASALQQIPRHQVGSHRDASMLDTRPHIYSRTPLADGMTYVNRLAGVLPFTLIQMNCMMCEKNGQFMRTKATEQLRYSRLPLLPTEKKRLNHSCCINQSVKFRTWRYANWLSTHGAASKTAFTLNNTTKYPYFTAVNQSFIVYIHNNRMNSDEQHAIYTNAISQASIFFPPSLPSSGPRLTRTVGWIVYEFVRRCFNSVCCFAENIWINDIFVSLALVKRSIFWVPQERDTWNKRAHAHAPAW